MLEIILFAFAWLIVGFIVAIAHKYTTWRWWGGRNIDNLIIAQIFYTLGGFVSIIFYFTFVMYYGLGTIFEKLNRK